jgi:MFS family permease
VTSPSITALRSARAFTRSGQGRLAIGIVLLEFVAAGQTFISSTLLPVIMTGLHAQRQLGLLVAGPTIGMFIALPLAARAIGRFGLRRVLLAALGGYLGGTVIAVTARDAAIFDASLRARLIAISSAMWIAPALAGPTIALALDHLIGWRWTMLAPFPLLVLGRC